MEVLQYRYIQMTGEEMMNKCVDCKVEIFSNHAMCPLCGRHMENVQQCDIQYPKYTQPTERKNFLVKKCFLFLSLSIIILCIFINFFTYKVSPTLWSLIVGSSIAFIWTMIRSLASKRISVGGKILIQFTSTSVLIVVIDVCAGFTQWSTTYVIPFLIITVTLMYTILAVRSKKSFREYFGYLLTIFFISFCPFFIYIFSLSTQAWSSLVAVLYCLVTAIALLIFIDDDLKEELKKRFHV